VDLMVAAALSTDDVDFHMTFFLLQLQHSSAAAQQQAE
jgi:hypothetical protein